jgi:nucleolin
MATEDARKLFVAGLPDTITEDVLRQLFEATGGTVVDVSIPRDRATGRPRGFGFVTLATSEEAASARDSLDGTFQAGKSISVRPFQAEPPRREAGNTTPPPGATRPSFPPGPFAATAPDRTLYVGNLPYDCAQEEIETLINATGAGAIARVNLPIDADGRKRGFGFVTMESAEVARAAMDALRTAELRGRRLVINIAHPKGDRPARPDGPPSGPRAPMSQRPPSPGERSSFRPPPMPMPPPDQPRKTFDERRRNPAARPETDSEGRGKRPGKVRERERRSADWADYDDDDE